MHLTTVPLSSLLPSNDNPRQHINKAQIAELAQSIRNDGLLQNLIVRREGGERFRVVAGQRRYLALQHLRRRRTVESDYQVPVEIVADLSEQDLARLAIVENVQREQLHPMDEGQAFARLLQLGSPVEAITEQTGLSPSTVRRRLALGSLVPEAQEAFRSGLFSRGIAEALTLGSPEWQLSALDRLRSSTPPSAEDIRQAFLARKPTLSMAIFPRDRYQGTCTTDLFGKGETTYFDDIDQFHALQNEAVEALAEEHRASAAWVEVLRHYTPAWWHYREARPGEAGGVVINLHPVGSVEVRENLVRHEVEEAVTEATKVSPIAPRPAKEKPLFTAELLRYAANQRSAVIQAALLANPRKAKEAAAVLLLLGCQKDFGVKVTAHACHETLKAEQTQWSYQAIDQAIASLFERLGLVDGDQRAPRTWPARLADLPDVSVLQSGLTSLLDDELERLLIALPILCIGQRYPDTVDEGLSLLNSLAAGLSVCVRAWWTPDAVFLDLLTREQLLQVARESGAEPHLAGMNGWTKRRLVEALVKYFADHADPGADADRAAAEWLPGLLRFPALKSLS